MEGEAAHGAVWIVQAVAILGTALLFVTVFRRLGLGAVLGYLMAGALLGPHGLGAVQDPEAMLGAADIGVALLLFLVGMELNPSRLWRLKQDIFGFGIAQVLVTGLVLALAIAWWREPSWGAAIAIGMPLALSSTAQVLPFLRSSGEINTRLGERAFSILLLQDLAIVPMLIILSTLSRVDGDATAGGAGWQLALTGLAAVAGLVMVGRFLLNPLFRVIGRVSERELFVVAGLFTVIGAAAVMQALGLPITLGAFVAGVMLADSPYRHELEADVDPFRSILLGLFFIVVGMTLDLGAIAQRPLQIVAMALALVVIKAALLFAVARAFGVEARPALRLGLLLSQGGEFAFVMFGAAVASGLIGDAAVSTYSAVVTLSMATTPFLMMLNDRLQRRAPGADTSRLEGPSGVAPTEAIVVGFGRFGQTVAQLLMAKGIGVTLIDSKPSQIEMSGAFGLKVYYGDGTRIDLLRQAGAGEARLLLFCIDGPVLDRRRIEPILEAFPHAAVYVRAFDRRQVMALDGAELAGVVREVFESAVSMGREALLALGVEEDEVARIERGYRERDTARLEGQSRSGDIKTLKHTMFRPGSPMGDGEGTPEVEPQPG